MSEERSYYIINDVDEAEKLIDRINTRMNLQSGQWDIPHKHPIENKWLITYDPVQNSNCLDLFNKYENITTLEAKKRGWYFGYFKGTFARERAKLEDIHFIFDVLEDIYGLPNFPAVKALTLSFLSACYSLKGSLDTIITKTSLNEKLGKWWADRRKEQDKKGELLMSFNIFMNNEKHGGALSGQIAPIDIEPNSQIKSLIIQAYHPASDLQSLYLSAEGAFTLAFPNSPKERRFPVGIHEAIYEVHVISPPSKHLGIDITGISFFEMMKLIKKYYEDILFEAEQLIGERPK